MQPQVTRIAPSPTGQMHFGTARTALFNWLAAQASGGKMILRIDDTDVARNKSEYTAGILESLDFMGITPDATYYQSERGDKYRASCAQLKEKGYATELDNGAVALKWHSDMPREWKDEISGTIQITDQDVEHIDGRVILTKGGDSLGQPTYQLASTFDDCDMNISHVIRGVDHVSNTAKQVALHWAMSKAADEPYVPPLYSHVGLVHKGKKKLSKRDGAESILKYRDEGYLVDALWNSLIRLGWAPSMKAAIPMKDDKSADIIGRARAFEVFLNSGAMKNSPANFDQAKLDFYNKKHKAILRNAS